MKPIKINIKVLILTIILIPFLRPQGFERYFAGYKTFFTVYLYLMAAICCIYLLSYFIKNSTNINKLVVYSGIFFGFEIIETIIVAGKISQGFQKLVIVPIITIFSLVLLNLYSKEFIEAIYTVLMLDMVLNATVFNPIVFDKIVGYTNAETPNLIQFIGHVQTGVMYGGLGILIGYILAKKGYTKKAALIVALSIVTMVIVRTDAGYSALAVLAISYLLKNKLKLALSSMTYNLIFNIMMIFSMITLLIVVGCNLSFGARYQVYVPIINLLKGHWLFGYGVYGVKITPLWARYAVNLENYLNSQFNYAHNDLLQHLLDGGIVLLLIFVIYINKMLSNIPKALNRQMDSYWSKIALIVILMDGICESVTEYNFFFIMLAIIACQNTIHMNWD